MLFSFIRVYYFLYYIYINKDIIRLKNIDEEVGSCYNVVKSVRFVLIEIYILGTLPIYVFILFNQIYFVYIEVRKK